MATTATHPSPPPDVAAVFETCPIAVRDRVLLIRNIIFDTAAELDGVAPVTETLKWGEPAYLTEKTKSGTTIRLGWNATTRAVSLYVHCQTSLVGEWRTRYDDTLEFVGNRELRLSASRRLPKAAIKHCIAMALTYHARKRR